MKLRPYCPYHRRKLKEEESEQKTKSKRRVTVPYHQRSLGSHVVRWVLDHPGEQNQISIKAP